MAQPSAAVLAASGISSSPQTLPVGRGLCFVAGGIVLKPSDDDAESQWVAQLMTKMMQDLTSKAYRLPRPITVANNPDSFVYDGWTASSLPLGHAGETIQFQHVLHVSRAFHPDIAKLGVSKPLFLTTIRNRSHEADLVTRGEKDLNDVADVNAEVLSIFRGALDDLKSLEQPLPKDLASQAIQGDLTGNVFFDSQSADPPGIIDMALYWQPPEYAEAIVITDGLAWHRQGRDLMEMLGVDGIRLQLLVRALFRRCITFAINSGMNFVRLRAPRVDFRGAARIVRTLIDEAKVASVNVEFVSRQSSLPRVGRRRRDSSQHGTLVNF
ncbi:phosphotransferase family protein [Dactylonectria estremocensis]|uniref:Phosphotransferase family protein n=1 Tax=Dactylonectria estremocensis TaxID=1079267 RepID=A0A9P9E9H4_9HYPO|nr:phosphotransferase family protein [Dactylonectria estremocensis]